MADEDPRITRAREWMDGPDDEVLDVDDTANVVCGLLAAYDEQPTEAEVQAATDAVLDWGPEDFNRLSHREICEGLARAAMLAARDVRKGAK